MKRPLAYITAPWSNSQYENAENAAAYCRQVYDAGYSPICPVLFLPTFLKDEIPQEHKDGLDMARDYLRRSHVLALIEQKMSQLGTKNREAYLRKMALDGYVVQLDLPELKELVSLLRRSSNNLNQLTRRVHETGRVYDADLEDIAQRQEQLWEGVKKILTQLSNLS